MERYLMRGRRLFADNWYSSISLAQRLMQNETDFVGTFRRNRRGFSKRLVQKKQKKGEIMALRKDGITLMTPKNSPERKRKRIWTFIFLSVIVASFCP
uniref:PiggyBac transposable element-derived protein domain-containing protein n=1 Tax=Acrobeloides nanus TaxID=290746 RepID=A0A914CZY0_9BILA